MSRVPCRQDRSALLALVAALLVTCWARTRSDQVARLVLSGHDVPVEQPAAFADAVRAAASRG